LNGRPVRKAGVALGAEQQRSCAATHGPEFLNRAAALTLKTGLPVNVRSWKCVSHFHHNLPILLSGFGRGRIIVCEEIDCRGF
jgi:hypothetical protein